MAILFDKISKYIIIEAPATSVTCQNLINAIRDYEDELVNFDIPHIAEASGKDVLGPGLYTGITLKLIDWKLKFEDRDSTTPEWVACEVGGGNLLSWDTSLQEYVNPIVPSSYVTATRTSSVAAALIESDSDTIATKVWGKPIQGSQSPGTFGELMKKTEKKVDDAQALILGT